MIMNSIYEVKFPQEESLIQMTKVFVNGSLHWFIWKRNIFAFDVKMKSYFLFPLSPLASEAMTARILGLSNTKENL